MIDKRNFFLIRRIEQSKGIFDTEGYRCGKIAVNGLFYIASEEGVNPSVDSSECANCIVLSECVFQLVKCEPRIKSLGELEQSLARKSRLFYMLRGRMLGVQHFINKGDPPTVILLDGCIQTFNGHAVKGCDLRIPIVSHVMFQIL